MDRRQWAAHPNMASSNRGTRRTRPPALTAFGVGGLLGGLVSRALIAALALHDPMTSARFTMQPYSGISYKTVPFSCRLEDATGGNTQQVEATSSNSQRLEAK